MFLLRFSDNYADEFDICGFRLITEPQLDALNLAVAKLPEDFDTEYYFGSNEEVMLTKSDLEELLEGAEKMTKCQTKNLVNLFPDCTSYGYGMFPRIEQLITDPLSNDDMNDLWQAFE